MSMTVAICTWNRATLLRQTLERLVKIPRPGTAAELIVVDNGSTDDTESVAQQFADSIPMRIIRESSPGLSNARNRALQEARTTHVLFTDDDVLVDEQWLHAFSDAIVENPDAAAFGGPIEPWYPTTPDPVLSAAFPALSWGFCGLDHHRPLGVLPPPLEIFGANFGVRVDALGDLRFDPRLGPKQGYFGTSEETLLIDGLRARGLNVVWVPGMRVRHYVAPERMTLDYLLAFYHDFAKGEARRKGPPVGARVLGVPRWVLRQVVQARARALWNRLRRNRLAELIALREYRYYSGMAVECFALYREGDRTTV